MDNNIGKRLDGRYELIELIGVGGMADIYKAHDIVDNRTVAVKILKTELATNDDFLRRFRNESKAIALLSHPNIVKIYDVGFSAYIQFIVMEYIDGINLTEYIQSRGALKWKDALHFILQVLKALQHAHDRGIVHRDIKSQNIMLLSDGSIKVMDFGIAHFNRETNKTMSEKAIGSVHYISPEQARGDVTDEKSDIYSVGIMLYEMLTGKKPFEGENPVSIALKHMQTPPKKPVEINPDIPDGLEEIILKAMQKNPLARYQTAGEMIKDIDEFKSNPSIVFEYKYFTPDTTPKYFDKAESLRTHKNQPLKERSGEKMRKKSQMNDIEIDDYDEYEDYDEYDEYEDYEALGERRSPFLSILFAVASVFVIMTAILIYKIVSDSIGGKETTFITMPNVQGELYDDVRREYPNLNINPEREHSSDIPKDHIIRQGVPPGRSIKSSQEVQIVVSSGPRLIELDDYGNGTSHMNDVRAHIEKQGFRVTIKYEESDTVPQDYVIRTDPPARTSLKPEDEVIVYISFGSVSETKVPNMIGLDRYTAEENAKAYKILLSIVNEPSNFPEGTVIRQSIAPNTEVEEMQTVEIVISTGDPPAKEGRILINFRTSNAHGNYKIEYYIDGEYQDHLTEIRDIELKNKIDWRFEDSGLKTYAIYLTSIETGKRAKLCEYEFDFTEGDEDFAYGDEVFMNERIFTELREESAPSETSEAPATATEAPATSESADSPRTTAPVPDDTPVTSVQEEEEEEEEEFYDFNNI